MTWTGLSVMFPGVCLMSEGDGDMPELPDVETFRRYMAVTSLHKKIKEVTVRSREILEGVSISKLKAGLVGKRFDTTRRHGKYLAALLDSGKCLVMHFGMTGFLKYFKKTEKEPAHERFLITFANGYHLAYHCQRKLGRVILVENFDQFIEEKALGPDALAPDLDFDAFKEEAVGRRASIKSFLMNQQCIAGIGNIYSDEILFQAGIHPKTRTDKLADKALQGLFSIREEVLKTAISHQADPEAFPGSYITARRGGDEKCPRCGKRLRKTKVSGRTAYYCPDCQSS